MRPNVKFRGAPLPPDKKNAYVARPLERRVRRRVAEAGPLRLLWRPTRWLGSHEIVLGKPA
jgi:hypothetical protein